jgi:hypothetical protein
MSWATAGTLNGHLYGSGGWLAEGRHSTRSKCLGNIPAMVTGRYPPSDKLE